MLSLGKQMAADVVKLKAVTTAEGSVKIDASLLGGSGQLKPLPATLYCGC